MESYGKFWQTAGKRDWYNNMYAGQPIIHEKFLDWLGDKEYKSVLEIGCGDGIYSRTTFDSTDDYTGIDISKLAISEAEDQRINKNHTYKALDWIREPIVKKYDLVFSHSVIDHVYDIDQFLWNCIASTDKYMYITAYNGYYPDAPKHNYIEDTQGINSLMRYRQN